MYTLLIVEDEELVRKGIKRLLPFEEFNITEIIEADNGEEGLKLFLAHRPDIVLLDINIPKLNGLEFARKAKEAKPAAKIAVITGYDYYEYAVTALKIGIDDYVLKPVSKSDVYDVLRKLVEKLQGEQQLSELQQVVSEYRTTLQMPEDSSNKAAIAQIIEVNVANPDFSLAMLANQVGFSSGYMSVLFKRLFNVSFQDYLMSTRLERSKLQLLSSDMKIYEISTSNGFDNPNYFSAAFKKKFGLSPLQYRERIKRP
ncbi:response regulator transcription factor [Paenibacillus sacheonensis]|uniref:Response regulator n=1 Tax=Paenibacillus sacheonensis TaxID=742054 RepID=A0A7X4YQD9_9BACL|nr:response regulator [Paenibacillus sacheonensis]MBM7566381.1 two-component system response regulator YesN [Paenibacillus sacheonensis]NBC70583.1 response regulator [Paenibacillus sacheonensis]